MTLISHSSKILLKIIADQMKIKMDQEISEEQCGFRAGKGTRDQILNLKMILKKSRECGNNLYICFIDYRKAFNSVVHDVLWTSMVEMGFPAHIIQLIEGRYDNQKAVVRTNYGLAKFFHIGKGVHQGCILSPHLFNIYSEKILRTALQFF